MEALECDVKTWRHDPSGNLTRHWNFVWKPLEIQRVSIFLGLVSSSIRLWVSSSPLWVLSWLRRIQCWDTEFKLWIAKQQTRVLSRKSGNSPMYYQRYRISGWRTKRDQIFQRKRTQCNAMYWQAWETRILWWLWRQNIKQVFDCGIKSLPRKGLLQDRCRNRWVSRQ